MRHATPLYVLLNFTLMRDATLLHVLLNFALMRHATLLHVPLNFALMHASCYASACSLELCTDACVMLRYCLFSWTLHSWVMLRTPPWHIMINMCSCGVGVQACRVQILKGSWKNWRRCSDQKTAKNMRQRISFRLARKPNNGSFVLAKWLFSSYCLWITGWRPQK